MTRMTPKTDKSHQSVLCMQTTLGLFGSEENIDNVGIVAMASGAKVICSEYTTHDGFVINDCGGNSPRLTDYKVVSKEYLLILWMLRMDFWSFVLIESWPANPYSRFV